MRVSNQKFIARNRPPRVHITYNAEVFGAAVHVELPFVVGVMADLAGRSPMPPVGDRRFRDIDSDNFDWHLEILSPRVAFSVPDVIAGVGEVGVDLTFTRMDDFKPDAVAARVEPLATLLRARVQIQGLLSYQEGKYGAETIIGEVLGDTSLRQRLSDANADTAFVHRAAQAFQSKSDVATKQLVDALTALALHAGDRGRSEVADVATILGDTIRDIDDRLGRQLNLIQHHPDFQALEGRWRGLYYLVSSTEPGGSLKIRVLSISREELEKTLRRYSGTAWDQSPIFKQLYESTFGQFGGEPFGCVIGDYYFGPGPSDIQVLGEMARIAAAVHAPFIAGASPSVMQLENWRDIANPRDLSAVFKTTEYAAWRSLRESDAAKYVTLAMPRFLARPPYGADYPLELFDFREEITPGEPACYVWANSAYALGACITRAFSAYGWTARIRGVESGGGLEGLPVHTFPTETGGVDTRCPTEIAMSDRWDAELARNGLSPLVHRKDTETAAFLSPHSLHRPPEYDDPELTASAALSARLPYLLACCRFAQYLKTIVRDRAGSTVSRTDLEQQLNEWLQQFVDPDTTSSSDANRARRPLADAQLVLDEDEGQFGHYTAKLFIRPHYQLEGLAVSNRLIVRLVHGG